MNELKSILDLAARIKRKLNSLRDKDNDGMIEMTQRDKNDMESNIKGIEEYIRHIQRTRSKT